MLKSKKQNGAELPLSLSEGSFQLPEEGGGGMVVAPLCCGEPPAPCSMDCEMVCCGKITLPMVIGSLHLPLGP